MNKAVTAKFISNYSLLFNNKRILLSIVKTNSLKIDLFELQNKIGELRKFVKYLRIIIYLDVKEVNKKTYAFANTYTHIHVSLIKYEISTYITNYILHNLIHYE